MRFYSITEKYKKVSNPLLNISVETLFDVDDESSWTTAFGKRRNALPDPTLRSHIHWLSLSTGKTSAVPASAIIVISKAMVDV